MFLHSATTARTPSQDCKFWVNGHCKFSEQVCGKTHDPNKKGGRENDDNENVMDFLVSGLARVMQTSARDIQTRTQGSSSTGNSLPPWPQHPPQTGGAQEEIAQILLRAAQQLAGGR